MPHSGCKRRVTHAPAFIRCVSHDDEANSDAGRAFRILRSTVVHYDAPSWLQPCTTHKPFCRTWRVSCSGEKNSTCRLVLRMPASADYYIQGTASKRERTASWREEAAGRGGGQEEQGASRCAWFACVEWWRTRRRTNPLISTDKEVHGENKKERGTLHARLIQAS